MKGMAILINEWGTTPMPPAAPHLMLQGVAGVDAAARTLGKGLTDAADAAAELADEQEQVTGTGELAGFAARLHRIGQETREEMAARRIRDWDAAWQQTSEPLLLEAVNELPENVSATPAASWPAPTMRRRPCAPAGNTSWAASKPRA